MLQRQPAVLCTPSGRRRTPPCPPCRHSLSLRMCCLCSSRHQLTMVRRDALASQLRAPSIQSLGGPLPPNATGEYRGGHQPLRRRFPAMVIASRNDQLDQLPLRRHTLYSTTPRFRGPLIACRLCPVVTEHLSPVLSNGIAGFVSPHATCQHLQCS